MLCSCAPWTLTLFHLELTPVTSLWLRKLSMHLFLLTLLYYPYRNSGSPMATALSGVKPPWVIPDLSFHPLYITRSSRNFSSVTLKSVDPSHWLATISSGHTCNSTSPAGLRSAYPVKPPRSTGTFIPPCTTFLFHPVPSPICTWT